MSAWRRFRDWRFDRHLLASADNLCDRGIVMNHSSTDAHKPSNYDQWRLLTEHVNCFNCEKQLIWNRFSASLTSISIFFAAISVFSTISNTSPFGKVAPCLIVGSSFIGVLLSAIWLCQTHKGWKLQNARMETIRKLQLEIKGGQYSKYPIIVGKENETDFIGNLAFATVLTFMLAFLALIWIFIHKLN